MGDEVNHGPRPKWVHGAGGTVLDVLRHHAERTPDRVALVLPEGEGGGSGHRVEVTYGQLWTQTEQIARSLVGSTAPGDWVLLALPQGLPQICAVWGVLRAGCGYVPVDVSTSASRLRVLINETCPTVVIGLSARGDSDNTGTDGAADSSSLRTVASERGVPFGSFPDGGLGAFVVEGSGISGDDGEAQQLPVVTHSDRAILFFSSGSSGVPKGVVYAHRWLLGACFFFAADLGLTPESRCLLRCSYVWSVSLYDLFSITLCGGVLFIPPQDGHRNVQYIAETIARESIHVVVIQPTLLKLLLDENGMNSGFPLRSLHHVVSSGEKLDTPTAVRFADAGLDCILWNLYGASEAGCCYWRSDSMSSAVLQRDFPGGVPAGVPQSYVDVWVMRPSQDDDDLGDALEPVPTGDVGEICFGGGGLGFLATGYWRRDELTAEKFVDCERFGRLYRTGDVGRWHNGQLVVQGRVDRQVKVRGVRIQPEEIESVLKRFGDGNTIKACIVVPSMAEPIELTAFVETAVVIIDLAVLKAYLIKELGRAYVPKHLVAVPSLPRGHSGKPDIVALQRRAAGMQHDVSEQSPRVGSQPALSGAPSALACAASPVLATPDHAVHGILGKMSRSAEKRDWTVDLSSNAFRFALDHKYRGEPIFPASGFVALAAEACEAVFPRSEEQRHWELTSIEIRSVLPLSPPPLVHVSASPARVAAPTSAGPGEHLIRISTLDQSGESVLHCICRGKSRGASTLRHRPAAAAAGRRANPGNSVSGMSHRSRAGDRSSEPVMRRRGGGGGGGDSTASNAPSKLEQDGPGMSPAEIGQHHTSGPPPRDRPDTEYSTALLYSQLAEGGFDYGILFQRLVSAHRHGNQADGIISPRPDSAFVLDPVDFDACFHLAPLVDPLGFQGAPVKIDRVQWFAGADQAGAPGAPLRVSAIRSRVGTDFTVVCGGGVSWTIEGLELHLFETEPPEVAVVTRHQYVEERTAGFEPTAAPRVVSLGSAAVAIAGTLAEFLGSRPADVWQPSDALAPQDPRTSVVLVAVPGASPFFVDQVEELLPTLGHSLPYGGRVWLVIAAASGTGVRWQSMGRQWAAQFPNIMLSVLRIDPTNPTACSVLRDPVPPPAIDDGWLFRLMPPPPPAGGTIAGLPTRGIVAVLTPKINPLAQALVAGIRAAGGTPVLVLPGRPAPPSISAAIFCALDGDARVVSGFAPLCLAAPCCVTLTSIAALLPLATSSVAVMAAQAAADSRGRAAAGHLSTVVYIPPLLSGTWFEPPGPTGVHRIGIETLMESLREVPSGVEVVIGTPVTQLKHWKMVLGGSSTSAGKSAVELRTFLRTEVASILGVHAGTIAEDRGLDSLGVDSLATLRLSQRLRKFLDRNISAFALQNNPTITSLVETLTHGEAAVAGSVRGTVICFHGFKTSGNILEQQMRLLTVVLHGMGFKVVFPNGPHRTSGAAQFAAGLDEDDAYAWYTYSDEALLGTSAIGLDATLALVESLSEEFAGVVGFSQGGGIAAQFAKQVGAKFAVLFSPVHVPGQSAWCTCPTLVLRDPNDTVAADTTTLIAELPADSTEVLDHSEGHRFPTAPPLYANIASFVSAAMSQ